MRRSSMLVLFAAASVVAPSCNTGSGGKVGKDPKGDLPPDHPPVTPRAPARGMRRMSYNQFASSLPITTGGTTWVEGGVPVYPTLAASMGKPDYIYVTAENLEPNSLFQKFVSDGAQNVCQDVVKKDTALPADRKVLMRFAGAGDRASSSPAVQKNLEYLRLRFHGTRPANDPVLPALGQVFDKTIAGGGTVDLAWSAVCVALIDHPDFLLY